MIQYKCGDILMKIAKREKNQSINQGDLVIVSECFIILQEFLWVFYDDDFSGQKHILTEDYIKVGRL